MTLCSHFLLGNHRDPNLVVVIVSIILFEIIAGIVLDIVI